MKIRADYFLFVWIHKGFINTILNFNHICVLNISI
jgi:hypothetical protein